MIKHIRVASDLHLEAFNGLTPAKLMAHFIPADPRDAESILFLAGDISSCKEQLLDFLAEVCRHFPKVYYVAGNHEFYRHDYVKYSEEINTALLSDTAGIYENLEWAFNTVSYEELGDEHTPDFPRIRIIAVPLWADGGPTLEDRGRVGFYLNDFRLITMPSHLDPSYRSIPRKFSVHDMMTIHNIQKAQILEYLETPFDGRTIVLTHHLPSRRLVSKRFWPGDGSDGANGGFASNCDNMIAVHKPWLWVHGHTHDTLDEQLWETRVVCQPAGYRGEWATPHNNFMQPQFDPANPTAKAEAVPKFIDL